MFDHAPFFPSKLVVFALDGRILAEYWHPGYIRMVATGKLGKDQSPYVVASASYNALRTSFWNPQTLFAFRGLDIAGQAPPYRGAAPHGTEAWHYVIPYMDENHRPKAGSIDFLDTN